jgi:hypothetical protein
LQQPIILEQFNNWLHKIRHWLLMLHSYFGRQLNRQAVILQNINILEVAIHKLLVVIIVISSTSYFAQDLHNEEAFSSFNLSILGGTNFSGNSSPGGSLLIEGKTFVFASTILKASIGYSFISEDVDYSITRSHPIYKDGSEGYQINTYSISQVQYSVFPINLGLEYIFLDNHVGPFGILEIGYNFFSAEEQIESGTGVRWFDGESEIRENVRIPLPNVNDGHTYSIGVGIGFKYAVSTSTDLNVRYIYRYHDSILNISQILLGVTF